MPNPKTKSARRLALNVLNQFTPQRHDAAKILHDCIEQTTQKAHATDLVFGVIRNRDTIDMVIEKIADRHPKRIQQKILNILRLGTYEIIFSPRTAEYAIVNEAANLAHQVAGRKSTGFVNAVLRRICQSVERRTVALSQANIRNTLPQTSTQGCEFKLQLLPDPADEPCQYLSKAFSLPQWLVTGWLSQFGFEETKNICYASNRRPGIYLRPNPLKTTIEILAEKLVSEQVDFDVTPDSSMIKLKTHRPVTELPGFTEGFFSVQDITASKPALVLNPLPGSFIVDLCAAPGGKTTQMAELMQNEGQIIATDIDQERLRKVTDNCQRLGISIVDAVKYDNFNKSLSKTSLADAVLLDVPCSNTAVLARRSEVRLRLKPKAIEQLARTQMRLLESSATIVKPEGKICYSTCSLQKQENQEVVQNFLKKNSEFTLVSQTLTLPSADGFDCDGGFVAILAKKQART